METFSMKVNHHGEFFSLTVDMWSSLLEIQSVSLWYSHPHGSSRLLLIFSPPLPDIFARNVRAKRFLYTCLAIIIFMFVYTNFSFFSQPLCLWFTFCSLRELCRSHSLRKLYRRVLLTIQNFVANCVLQSSSNDKGVWDAKVFEKF